MSGCDLFGTLPDELLNHVLSFLPSQEAVQASLLSRRWRHLWRSTPAISIRGMEGEDFHLFVSTLLLGRHAEASSPPLRSFEIDANELLTLPYNESRDDYDYDVFVDEDEPKVDRHVDLWVRHALSAFRARSLTVRTKNEYTSWRPRSPPFATPHLTTLHLEHVHLVDGLLDFSRCPALLQLTLVHCHLECDALVSPSLERLSVLDCDIEIGDWDKAGVMRNPTKRISTPSLRCLELSDGYTKEEAALFLRSKSMPWLTDPSIQRTGKTTIYSRKR